MRGCRASITNRAERTHFGAQLEVAPGPFAFTLQDADMPCGFASSRIDIHCICPVLGQQLLEQDLDYKPSSCLILLGRPQILQATILGFSTKHYIRPKSSQSKSNLNHAAHNIYPLHPLLRSSSHRRSSSPQRKRQHLLRRAYTMPTLRAHTHCSPEMPDQQWPRKLLCSGSEVHLLSGLTRKLMRLKRSL